MLSPSTKLGFHRIINVVGNRLMADILVPVTELHIFEVANETWHQKYGVAEIKVNGKNRPVAHR